VLLAEAVKVGPEVLFVGVERRPEQSPLLDEVKRGVIVGSLSAAGWLGLHRWLLLV
jgi:hypothetical protein